MAKGGWKMRSNILRMKQLFKDEEGIGVVEVILILLVLVGLVIIFKDQIVALANSIFSNITNQVDGI